ncbi:hypothetical protein [Agromyces atrinae]|uniref:Putative alkaline shock family protein YloU n=1 Tax=Agromyces atrinae TaxID=592376 RepID=A0A4Q2M4C4_9MICO|nr:hypothetical protein [Agromyces atrinae]NYD68718.1 putative alkaline shock family protein YloU [Agromyces atrinae]RXZ86077.1 hypothetical protein ESP50_12835 [Agromyces atrinae]
MTAVATPERASEAVDLTDRGRNRVTAKALTRVVAAVTADALGVKASRVGVGLSDDKGLLVLTVTTPIRVASLTRVHAAPGVVERSGGTIVDRAARAQETIRERVSALTGSQIARVTVKLSAADIQEEERVR